MNAWDIAAGALMVEQAGGSVSLCDGMPFASRVEEIVASNGQIHSSMVSTIQGWQADRSGERTT